MLVSSNLSKNIRKFFFPCKMHKYPFTKIMSNSNAPCRHLWSVILYSYWCKISKNKQETSSAMQQYLLGKHKTVPVESPAQLKPIITSIYKCIQTTNI